MPRGYTVRGGQSTAASSTKTSLTITAPSTRLVRLVRRKSAQTTHKTSEQYEMFAQRASAAGTGAASPPTPEPDEPNGGAAGSTIAHNHSAEPTYTAGSYLHRTGWNSLTGRDIPEFQGQDKIVAPSAIVGIANTTPAATTTFTPIDEVGFQEAG